MINKINNCKHLNLVSINEDKGYLRIIFQESFVSNEAIYVKIGDLLFENLSEVVTNDQCNYYEIKIADYVGYSILNESNIKDCETNNIKPKHIETYNSSKYMEYLSKVAFNQTEIEWKHFQFNCSNHIVNVVTTEELQIKELSEFTT